MVLKSPRASTCMNCHSQILKDDPRLAILRDSAKNNTPVPWVQIHPVPDYVYFNHEVHVRRGFSCVECHGRVDEMDEMYHAKPLSMSFCSIAIAIRRRTYARPTRSRTWAGRGARMAWRPLICKRSREKNWSNTCAWNPNKAARRVIDNEFTIYNLRFTIGDYKPGVVAKFSRGQTKIGGFNADKCINCCRRYFRLLSPE